MCYFIQAAAFMVMFSVDYAKPSFISESKAGLLFPSNARLLEYENIFNKKKGAI
jgi:hypothetical protein